MTPPPAELPAGAGLALIRLRSLGDSVLITPALAALRAWRPDLRLAVVVEERFAAAFDGNPDISQLVVAAPGAAGRLAALAALRRFQPDVAVALHGGANAALLARLSGAPLRVHYRGLRHAWAFNCAVEPPPPPADGRPRCHTVEHAVALFERLGLPPQPPRPARVFPHPAARARVQARLRSAGVHGPFAFFSARPRSTTMRWPAEKFGALAAWLRRRYGWAAVVATPDPAAGVVVAGLSTAELIALEAESALFVGCDGGPMHVAAALGKPVVAIFSATDSVVWAPWQTSSRIVQNRLPCSPCPADRCYRYPEPRCILSVELAQVQAAVVEVLARSGNATPAAGLPGE